MLRSCLLSVLVAIGALLTCIGVTLGAGALFGAADQVSAPPPPVARRPPPPARPVEARQPPMANFDLYCDMGGRHHREAVGDFRRLERPNETDQYLVGCALMELERPFEAEKPLRSAIDAGIDSWHGWPSARALLDRVETCVRLSPPLVPRRAAGSTIALYANASTEPSDPILDSLDDAEAIGRAVFGEDLSPTRLHVFRDRAAFDSFYKALFGAPLDRKWAVGSAGRESALLCLVEDDGKRLEPGDPDTICSVVHELSHVWCRAYVTQRRGTLRELPELGPPWLVEGLAEYFESFRDPGVGARRVDDLRSHVRAHKPAPTLSQMRYGPSFYAERDVHVRYCVSGLLMAEFLGPPGDEARARIRKLLDAIAASEDAERAIQMIAGRDLDAEYGCLLARFW